MVEWYGARHNETFSFREVDWTTWQEIGEYNEITSGSVELSALSDTKASCKFDFEGGREPSTQNYARIYYSFTDSNGEQSGQIPLGTFMLDWAETENVGVYSGDTASIKIKGSANGSSVLKRLAETKLGYPYTVAAGTETIGLAKQIVTAAYLTHNNPQGSYTTSSAHTFEPDDSWLTVVNWLLSAASYQSAYVNAYGQVQMSPYVPPTARETVEVFQDGANAIFQPVVSVSNDWQNTPNEIYATYEDDAVSITSRAYVLDGAKFAYNQNGHRLITGDIESVDEITGATAAAKLAALKTICETMLRDKCNEIEHVSFTHAYIDWIAPNDAVALKYAGAEWSGSITNMEIPLSVGVQTKTKVRKFISNDLDLVVSGGINWQV